MCGEKTVSDGDDTGTVLSTGRCCGCAQELLVYTYPWYLLFFRYFHAYAPSLTKILQRIFFGENSLDLYTLKGLFNALEDSVACNELTFRNKCIICSFAKLMLSLSHFFLLSSFTSSYILKVILCHCGDYSRKFQHMGNCGLVLFF